MTKTITFSVPHSLAADEARTRVRSLIASQLDAAGNNIKTAQQWDDRQCRYVVEAMGMTVKGTLTFSDGAIDISAQIPMMVPGRMAEMKIREKLEPVLA